MRTRRLILPFFSICVTEARPISPVWATCVPPHGWRSRFSIARRRTRPVPVGGFDRHRLDQRRVRLQLLVRDPALGHGRVERDEFVELALHLRLVEERLAVEVEPALALADRAAGDGIGQHDREEVQRRVRAHAPVAPAPVDPRDDPRARRRERGPFGRHVQDRLPVGIVDRIDDRDRLAAVENDVPLVAGLAAALRIEDRPIEGDCARLGERHSCRRFAQVGIGAEEGFSHQTNTCGARRSASSQAGTGRFFERRKAGLKSLEA